jgi:hypothetical protein
LSFAAPLFTPNVSNFYSNTRRKEEEQEEEEEEDDDDDEWSNGRKMKSKGGK